MASGTPREHYDRWQRNARLGEALKASGLSEDWWIVLRFYSALHLLQAYLVAKGLHANTHAEQWVVVGTLPELRQFKDAYRRLRNISESVRYSPTFQANAEDEKNAEEHYQKAVSILRAKVERWLAQNDPKPQP